MCTSRSTAHAAQHTHTQHIVQHFTCEAIKVAHECRQLYASASGANRHTSKSLDVMASLDLLLKMLNGPGTEARRVVSGLAIHIACGSRAFPPKLFELLQTYMLRLEVINTLQSATREAHVL